MKLYVLLSCVKLPKAFMEGVSVESLVFETGGSSSNNVHLNSCPLVHIHGQLNWHQ